MPNLICGDCLDKLKELPDNSVDAVVTDPPYGLSFMGKKWDYDVPSEEIWRECLRVLKPGGHLLAFAGTRTQHRMAVRIEDAGFEIRDMIAWIYGSGFPKSLDVSKAIDKEAGETREIIGINPNHRKLKGTTTHGDAFQPHTGQGEITLPATDDAKKWNGWGTALKPALEPITVARKPLSEKTVAANVLKWGTGAINIDGGRVNANGESLARPFGSGGISAAQLNKIPHGTITGEDKTGRWPANLIHDGSDEVLESFPDTAPSKKAQRGSGINGNTFKSPNYASTERGYEDNGGSAARFFYCAKASKRDREEGCDGLPIKQRKGVFEYADRPP